MFHTDRKNLVENIRHSDNYLYRTIDALKQTVKMIEKEKKYSVCFQKQDYLTELRNHRDYLADLLSEARPLYGERE